jgi:hypothetical protein
MHQATSRKSIIKLIECIDRCDNEQLVSVSLELGLSVNSYSVHDSNGDGKGYYVEDSESKNIYPVWFIKYANECIIPNDPKYSGNKEIIVLLYVAQSLIKGEEI